MPETTRAHREGKAVALAFLFIVVIISWFIWHRIQNGGSTKGEAASETKLNVDLRDVRFWTATEVRRRIDAHENILILDTRTDEAYHTNHILGSKRQSLETLSAFVPQNGTEYVFLLDSTIDPARLKEADETLKAKKTQFAFLDGGISSWEAVGGETYSWGDPNNPVDQSKVTYISSEKANELLQSNNTLVILDIREPNDFHDGHLPRAINIPLSNLEGRSKELPLGKEYLVYGADELTAFQGAVRLFDMHFFGPRVLEGGFGIWSGKKLPIEK